MICPECKSEFKQGILKCSDCGVELVPALPPEPPRREPDANSEDIKFVEVVRTLDMGLAAFIESVFNGEGLEYYVLGKDSNLPLMAPTPIIIRVREDQVERALELLQEIAESKKFFSNYLVRE